MTIVYTAVVVVMELESFAVLGPGNCMVCISANSCVYRRVYWLNWKLLDPPRPLLAPKPP